MYSTSSYCSGYIMYLYSCTQVYTLGGGLHEYIQYKTSIRTLVNHPLEGCVFFNGRGITAVGSNGVGGLPLYV